MQIIIIILLCTILPFDSVGAKRISELKCDETAHLVTDPRSIAPYLLEFQVNISRWTTWNCSATLISENFVLTSALCVANPKLLPFDIKIHKLKFPGEEYTNTQQFTAIRIIHHKSYNYSSLENPHNYALIQLNVRVPYQDNMSIYRPACLWTDFAYFDTFLLFGHDIRSGNRTAIFKKIPAANIALCLDFLEYKMVNRPININKSHLCFFADQDIYFSNQANPIMDTIGNQNYIFGIQSRTFANSTTRMIWGHKIYDVIDWIESIVWPPKCGRRKIENHQFITFGQPTYDGAFPWHVALYKNAKYNCGGTIINKRNILTAAHCVHDKRVEVPPNRIIILAGTHDLDNIPIEAQYYVLEAIICHPNFSRDHLENDIAVLKMRNDIEFSNFIQPICLSKTLDYDTLTIGAVAGWGMTENNVTSNVLLQANFLIKNSFECRESNREFFNQYLNDHNYCAGYQDGTNVCSGGSGGGGMIVEYKSNWYIRGIVSQGVAIPNTDRCDITEMVLFTDIPKLYNWIVENVQNVKIRNNLEY